MFYSRLIKSPFLLGLSFECGLHECFCPSFWVKGPSSPNPSPFAMSSALLLVCFVLCNTGRLGTGIGWKSPPPGGVRFQYLPLESSFTVKKNLEGLHYCFSSNLPSRATKGSSSWQPSEIFFGKRSQNYGRIPLMAETPHISLCHIHRYSASSNSSQLLVKWYYSLLHGLLLSLSGCTCLQISGCGLFWNFSSLID